MNTNCLIAGEVNPLIISKIVVVKAKRFGSHPYAARLFRKKYPFLSKLFNPHIFHMNDNVWEPAEVRINGSDGKIINIVYCNSNDAAVSIGKIWMDELNCFLDLITHKGG